MAADPAVLLTAAREARAVPAVEVAVAARAVPATSHAHRVGQVLRMPHLLRLEVVVVASPQRQRPL